MDEETELSLWHFYLSDTTYATWKEVHDLYSEFKEEGGSDFFVLPEELKQQPPHRLQVAGWIKATQEYKRKVISDFSEWVHNNKPSDMRTYTHLPSESETDYFTWCKVGPITLQQAGRDRKRTWSHFLACIPGGYAACRATGFIRHRPPGADRENKVSHVVFARTQWLLSPEPCRTTASDLFMVAMPDKDSNDAKWLKQDQDSGDGLLLRVWAMKNIHPVPVCGK